MRKINADKRKTKVQLIKELETLREEVTVLKPNPAAPSSAQPGTASLQFKYDDLRKKAENLLAASAKKSSDQIENLTAVELMHELEVHQIELEVQNDELRRTQENLEGERKKFKFLYEHAPLGYLTIDKSGLIQQANEAVAVITGFPVSYLQGRPFSSFIHKNSRNNYYAMLKRALESDERTVTELTVNGEHDKPLRIAMICKAAHSEGRMQHYHLMINDLTQLRDTETRLHESRRLTESITEMIPDIVLIYSFQSRQIEYANKQAEMVFGISREEEKKGTLDDFVCDEDMPRFLLHQEKLATAGDAEVLELTYCAKVDALTTMSIHSRDQVFMRNEDGTPASIIMSGEDITAHVTSREKIRRSEMLLRKVIDNIPVGIIGLTPAMEISLWNSGAEQITGITDESMTGENLFERVPGLETIRLREKLEKLLETTEPLILDNIEYNDTTFPRARAVFNLKAAPLFDNEESVTGIVMAVEDVTEQRLAEEALIEAKERAEEASRLKTNFLANMSHEIRTPMNGILGFSQVLMEASKTGYSETFQKYSNRIYESGKRLMKTLNDILDISQIESNKVELRLSPCYMNIIARHVYELMEKMAEFKNLTFTIEANDSRAVLVNEYKLYQALTNIVDNAIKYTREGGVTIITGEKEDTAEVFVRVKDTGIGISKDNMDTIFEPFNQEAGGFDRAFEGTGLGLTIAKKLVEMMKGRLEIQSAKNEGTIVSIFFGASR